MIRLFFALSLLALDLTRGAVPASAQSIDRCSQGTVEEMIAGCDMLIKRNPHATNSWILYHYRGFAWAGKHEYDKAIADFNEAIRLNPKPSSNSYVSRAGIWVEKRNYDKARADLTEAIRLDPNQASAYVVRGIVFERMGEYDRAIADYNESIRLNPTLASAYSNRGIAWSYKGDYDRAITDYNESIRLGSNNPAVDYVNRGAAWRYKGDYDRAISDYNESIRLGLKNARVYNNRGDAWSQKGEYDKAILDLNESIRLDPKLANPYNHRGTVWSKKGDLDNAIADYREAVRLNPNYPVAQENLQLALDKKQRAELRNTADAAPNELVVPSAGLPSGGKRVALIIGNSKYRNVPVLDNPVRDAELFAQTLRNLGFDDVAIKLNLSRAEMMASLQEFEKTANGADWAAIYFAGHGMEVGSVNYMVPIDAQMTDENSISNQVVNMEYLLNAVEVSKKLRLLILDACRNNPFAKQIRVSTTSRGFEGAGPSVVGRGLSRVEPQPGTLVVYSAKAGEYALDGDGKNSPFAEALVRRMEQRPAIEVRRLFDFVREDVVEATRKQQQPFAYGSLSAKDDFFFAR